MIDRREFLQALASSLAASFVAADAEAAQPSHADALKPLVKDTTMTTSMQTEAAHEWRSYLEGLMPLGERFADGLSDPHNQQLRQEAYRYIHSVIAHGYFILHFQDPKYPEFWPVFNQAFNFFLPNPDDIYYQSVIDDVGVYKISGYRGTRRAVDFQIGSGTLLAHGVVPTGPTLSNYDLDHDVHLGTDGAFEVVLSAERPAGWQGDWWRLEKGATYVWIRQVAYDLAGEMDGRFAIDRLDVPTIKPRDSADAIAAKMARLETFTRTWLEYNVKWRQGLRERKLVNKVVVVDMSSFGGIKEQRYVEGLFDIAPDEALILETELPERARYWAFQLGDELMASLDWTNHQVSLNGHSARIDNDGRFRAVISLQDPGVPNWLDTAGFARGAIFGRWKDCNRYPTPTVTKVKLTELRRHLPTDTPTVTPEQRDAALRAMRRATQLRRRW